MRKVIISTSVMFIIFLMSYIAIASKSTDEFPVTPLTLEEEILFYKQGIEESKKSVFQLDDPELEKWILRTISYIKMTGVNLTDIEIIEKAREAKQETDDFINFAEAHYGIIVTDELFDEFVTEHIAVWDEDLKNKQAVADLLGITMHDLNYDFDRDLNTRLIVWHLLEPIIDEKYSISEKYNNTDRAFEINNILLQKYAEEIEYSKK